jgi:ABC-type transporter Mla subunit MlaD
MLWPMTQRPLLTRIEGHLADNAVATREMREALTGLQGATTGIQDFMKETRRVMLESTSSSNRTQDSLRAFGGVITELRETVADHSDAVRGLARDVQGFGIEVRGLSWDVRALGVIVQETHGETSAILRELQADVRAQSDALLAIIDRLDQIVERLDRRNGDA